MITVQTRPLRLGAIQWHKPGDATEFGETPYRRGSETRYGVHSASRGMQPLSPGYWIVLGVDGGLGAQVFGPEEFNQRFLIVEEALA